MRDVQSMFVHRLGETARNVFNRPYCPRGFTSSFSAAGYRSLLRLPFSIKISNLRSKIVFKLDLSLTLSLPLYVSYSLWVNAPESCSYMFSIVPRLKMSE